MIPTGWASKRPGSYRAPDRPARAGFSGAELAVASLIGAAVALPLLALLFQERETEQRSRLQYLALLAARDAIEESRFALLAGAPVTSLPHDWRPLTGGPLERLGDAAPGLALDLIYAPEQLRIATRLRLEAASGGRIRLATVEARWADPLATSPPGGPAGRPSSLALVFGLLLPRGHR